MCSFSLHSQSVISPGQHREKRKEKKGDTERERVRGRGTFCKRLIEPKFLAMSEANLHLCKIENNLNNRTFTSHPSLA